MSEEREDSEIITVTKYTCEGCNRVFDDHNKIRNHVITCIRPVKGSAFQDMLIRRDISTTVQRVENVINNEIVTNNEDKTEALSQPLLTA